MKKTAKYIILFFLGTLTFIAVTMSIRLGVFKDVTFNYKEKISLNVLYKKHLGPYHEILTHLQVVEEWTKENNISCKQTFGEYMDDPDIVDAKRLRANVGCVVNAEIMNLPKGIFFKEISLSKYLSSEFNGSPAMGPLKVYPKAKELLKKDGLEISGAIIEIYTLNKATDSFTTEYIFPLN